MSKVYNSTWNVKALSVNFNHKIWRQDFGAFVMNKMFWDSTTKVTRSKAREQKSYITKGVKSFEVYNAYGGSVKVEYQNENEIISTTNGELVKQYFEERGIDKKCLLNSSIVCEGQMSIKDLL